MSTLVKRRMTVLKNNHSDKVPQVPNDVFRKRAIKEEFSAFKKLSNRDAEFKLLYSPATSIKNDSTLCSASNIDDE